MWVVILFTTLAACKDTDNRVFGDDFEFPALTDENTIRFTVNVVGAKASPDKPSSPCRK